MRVALYVADMLCCAAHVGMYICTYVCMEMPHLWQTAFSLDVTVIPPGSYRGLMVLIVPTSFRFKLYEVA